MDVMSSQARSNPEQSRHPRPQRHVFNTPPDERLPLETDIAFSTSRLPQTASPPFGTWRSPSIVSAYLEQLIR